MSDFTTENGLELITGASNPDEAFDVDMELIDDGLRVVGELDGTISKGQWVRFDGGLFSKATNATAAGAMVVGILTADGVVGDDRYAQYCGVISKTGWGLTANSQYYLSTAGNMTTVRPVSGTLVELGQTAAATDKFYIRIRIYTANTDHDTLGNLAWSVAGHTLNAALLPTADNTYDIGSVAASWKDVYADGTIYGATVQAATLLKFADGTVGAPGLAFKDDLDNGMYRIGTNNWALSAGGTKV